MVQSSKDSTYYLLNCSADSNYIINDIIDTILHGKQMPYNETITMRVFNISSY